jgi:hypothetical protein
VTAGADRRSVRPADGTSLRRPAPDPAEEQHVPAPQSAPASSSLGRYTPTDGSPPVPVRLLNVPVQVMAAAREPDG